MVSFHYFIIMFYYSVVFDLVFFYCSLLFFFVLFVYIFFFFFFFFSSRRRHTRWNCDWSSDVCSSDLHLLGEAASNGIKPRFTGTITVRYLRTTRLGRLHAQARIDRVEGVKT